MSIPFLASPLPKPSAAQPASRDYHIGQMIAGRYRLLQTLSEGAMGAVWIARDLILDLPVAVKLLHRGARPSSTEEAYLTDRLMREARATASIRHPGVVRVLDYGIALSAGPYLVLELLEGHSLGRRLRRGGRVLAERAVQVLLPIADALAAVHDGGFVHRDIKPDNVFLSRENHGRIQPKLIDFGLAKFPQTGPTSVLTGGGVLGTPEYMSPEQIIEASSVDRRADVWAFSVVLFEMLSGDVPFAGRSYPETLRSILDGPAPSLSTYDVDAALAGVVERGLAKDPAARWPSMRDIGAELAAWLSSRGVREDITGASLRTQWTKPGT
jgi:serine/threonine-protein kinase